jgi:hypothetical protein
MQTLGGSRLTLNKAISLRSDEILALSSYRVPVPFEHLYDDSFVPTRGTFIECLIEGIGGSLKYGKEGEKYTPLQHLAKARSVAGSELRC